jgi:hypothetical protein
MELFVNQLIEWIGETEGDRRRERILRLDASSDEAVTIDIDGAKAWPVRQRITDIEAGIESSELRLLTVDPYSRLAQPEHQLKATHKQHRDQSWAVIAPLVAGHDPKIFSYRSRNSPVPSRASETRKRKGTVYALLRRFWQRGQTKNALLPLFFRCGWKNEQDDKGKKKVRRRCDGKLAQKKMGRPTRLRSEGTSVGINIDDDVLRRIRRGIRRHYRNEGKKPLKKAYDLTMKDLFHTGYVLSRTGAHTPVLLPAEERPTYEQFKYWYWQGRSPRETQIARLGEGRFNLQGRALLGNPADLAFGPGSMFEIDSTVADVYLVSRFNRSWIIGRPIVYFVLDRFSHLVVGFSVALEGGWVGAMLSLENAASDKVSFCAEFGVPIEEWEWPSHHLPEAILADRGELEGGNADHLVNAFNIRVHNTPPGRADLKGIVEKHFDTTNQRLNKWVPGAVRKRERGDRDYRLDAQLDIEQFRKLILLSVLDYNKNKRLDTYHKDRQMIADEVEPYPLDLWNWGIKNRTGHLRTVPLERLRLNLLPEVKASITKSGIRCEGLDYLSELALREEWHERAGENGRRPLVVARDPRNLSQIYLRLDNGARMEVCYLKDTDAAFRSRDFYEAADEFELRKVRSARSKGRTTQAAVDLHAELEAVVAQAKVQVPQDIAQLSNRARVGGIKQNRKFEKAHERQVKGWQLGPDHPSQASATTAGSGHVSPQQIKRLRDSIQRRTQQ